jgi:hypothetical protein
MAKHDKSVLALSDRKREAQKLEDLENAMTDTSRPRHVVSPTLAESLLEAEASSFAESGIWPETDSEYMALKTRLLAGEITVDEAVELYCLPYTKKDMTPPQDDLWRPEDYDDEPRTNGNFGLDPFQQKCKEAAEKRELESRAETEKKERAG